MYKSTLLKQGTQAAYGHVLDVVNEYLLFLDNENPSVAAMPTDSVDINVPAKINQVQVINPIPLESGMLKVAAGETLTIDVQYQINSINIDAIVFVFNLYREKDDTYVCGTTTLMDGIPPIPVKPGIHSFKLVLPSLSLLSGKYRLRIAINEKKGVGIIAEYKDALKN